MRTSLKKLSLIFVFGGLLVSRAYAQIECSGVHSEVAFQEVIFDQLAAKNETQKSILEILKSRANSVQMDHSALELVFNHELRIFENRLLEVLNKIQSGSPVVETLKSFYESQFYPRVLQVERLKAAEQTWTEGNILKILGDLSEKEVLRLFVGPTPDRVMRDSLVGRYLQESGALLQKRAYTETNNAKGNKTGVERLLVPVSAQTFPIWQKYFSNQNGYSVFGHANTVFQGLSYSYAGDKSPLAALSPQTPLPFVLLKTTEGARLERYLEVVVAHSNGGWANEIKRPWQIPGYLSQNGNYNCCTHWHGNLPIGDRRVNTVTLPGAGDQPVIVEVREGAQLPADKPYLNEIWKGPMNEPISSLLGLADNNGRGEFASPGWVIQSLLVSAPIERVPFVVFFVNDVTQTYDANTPPRFENPW